MNERRISSWNELNERLYQDTWQEPLGRFRGSFAYRGVGWASADLRTSLMRLGSKAETHLLRNFRKYAQRDAVPGDSVWNWLALGQHHGLPTRLLDWTFSPLVAMHFATAELDLYGEEGVIWRVNYVKVHELIPDPLRQILHAEQADVFTAEMLQQAAHTLPEFDALAREPFVVFLEPPSLDDRIVNQFALFALMSSPSERLDDWLTTHPELYERLLIPADLKWEVRDKLDQANVTERVLFPGLDGLSRWLSRYYTTK